MTSVDDELLAACLRGWADNGFFRIDGFARRETCDGMLDRVVQIARARANNEDVGRAYVAPENNLAHRAEESPPAEELVSKIFKLHRDSVFHDFAVDSAVTSLVAEVVGPELDCFLSQFIFKNPGAWGQPWHQDSYYFRFEPPRPIAAVWLAVTEATLENGCLHVVPGSHREPVHEHVADRRPGANLGYVEIVDHDMNGAIPVLMQPGDLLVFDSHLMHRSTDNVSSGIRAAMVYHYCQPGTRERVPSRVNDFVPARRTA